MYGLTFNGIRKDYLVTLRGKRRPPWAPLDRNIIEVPSLPGGHHGGTEIGVRRLEIPVLIESRSLSHLKELLEDLGDWLVTDEPKELIFDDEPGRTYFAMVDGETDIEDLIRVGVGNINFICPDPFKYGATKSFPIDDNFNVDYEGTAEVGPLFRMEAKEQTTFAMVSNGEDYMMVGRPVDVDDIVTNKMQTILNDNCSSLVGWSNVPSGTQIDTGIVGGQMGVQGGYAFSAVSYGSNPNGWVGPAIRRSLSETVQDFRCEIRIGAFNTTGDVGSLELHLLDEIGDIIAVMAMRDATAKSDENKAVIQLGGEGSRRSLLNYNGGYRSTWNDFSGIIRLERVGNEFKGYVAVLDGDRHIRRYTTPAFYDTLGSYQGKLAQVMVYDAKSKTYEPYGKLMNNIYVGKINQQTGISYIAEIGDVIEFDHKTGDCYINGEPVPFDFGADFFNLKKGINSLTISPEGAFDSSITFRERYK